MSLSEYIRTQMDTDATPYLKNLDLKGVDFSGLTFGDVIVSKCNFMGSIFNQSNLDSTSFRDCSFNEAQFNETTASKADLTRSTFYGAKIDKCSFQEATLVDASFAPGYTPTEISNCNFDYADMSGAELEGAKVSMTHFDYANMQEVNGADTIFLNSSAKFANLTGANLEGFVGDRLDLTNAITHNASLEGGVLNEVKLDGIQGQGMNLNQTVQSDVTYKKADVSHSTMNNSTFNGVVFDNATMINMQAQQITADSSSITSTSHNHANQDAATHALQNKKQPEESLVIKNDTDARGLDLSGSKMDKILIKDSNLSHINAQNAVISNSTIEDTNLHGGDFSGKNGDHTEFHNTNLTKVNATQANLEGLEVEGGKWRGVNINGANLANSVLGTRHAPVNVHNITADATTNMSNAQTNMFDSKAPDQEAYIQVTNMDGAQENKTPQEMIKQSNRVEEVMATNAISAASAKAVEGMNTAANIASNIATTAKIHKKSRAGLITGIIAGLIAGVIIAAISTATFGAGGVAMAIIWGIAIGGGAIGGGLIGNLMQNTNSGRGVFALASAAVASIVVGPIGLIAAPAIALYNTALGRKSSLRSAFGSAIETVVAKPLQAVANFASSLVPSEKSVVEAQRIGHAREDAEKKLAEERKKIQEIKPDLHAQATAVGAQVTSNQLHAPITTLPPQAVPSLKTSLKKSVATTFRNVAHFVTDHLPKPKKKSWVEKREQEVSSGKTNSIGVK